MKLQPFLPWSIVRVAFTFCKKKKRNLFKKKMILNCFLVRSFLWSKPPPPNPVNEIEDYCTYFNNKYGARHPTFYRGLLSQVFEIFVFKKNFFKKNFRLYEMYNVKFDYYLFIYMIKILHYAIDFVGKFSKILN